MLGIDANDPPVPDLYRHRGALDVLTLVVPGDWAPERLGVHGAQCGAHRVRIEGVGLLDRHLQEQARGCARRLEIARLTAGALSHGLGVVAAATELSALPAHVRQPPRRSV